MSFPSPQQVNWRDLHEELAEATNRITFLQTRLTHAMQQSSEVETHLRARIRMFEEDQQRLQARLAAVESENEQLRQTAHGDGPAEVRRLREQRDAARRELRHALKLVHDLSGRIVSSPSPEIESSERFDTRREQGTRPTRSSAVFLGMPGRVASSPLPEVQFSERFNTHGEQGTRQTRSGSAPLPSVSPHPSVRVSRLAALSRLPSPRGQPSSVRVEDLAERHASPIPAAANEAEDDGSEAGSIHTDLTNVTYEDQVPQLRQPVNEQPAERQEADEPDEHVDPAGWIWEFQGLPASSRVSHGPLSEEQLIDVTGISMERMEGWSPLPTRRTLIHNDVALYANAVYLEYLHEPRRTVITNWGEPDVVLSEHGYIWPEGTAREFYTFVCAAHSTQTPQWWYVGKLQWLPTKRVPPWPTDLQVKRRIASRMLKIWNISLTKSEVLAHIEQRTFVEFNIELVSNEALAAQSARFLEERLGVPVDAAGSGPSGR